MPKVDNIIDFVGYGKEKKEEKNKVDATQRSVGDVMLDFNEFRGSVSEENVAQLGEGVRDEMQERFQEFIAKEQNKDALSMLVTLNEMPLNDLKIILRQGVFTGNMGATGIHKLANILHKTELYVDPEKNSKFKDITFYIDEVEKEKTEKTNLVLKAIFDNDSGREKEEAIKRLILGIETSDTDHDISLGDSSSIQGLLEIKKVISDAFDEINQTRNSIKENQDAKEEEPTLQQDIEQYVDSLKQQIIEQEIEEKRQAA